MNAFPATARTRYDYTCDERGQRTTAVQSGDAFADYGDATHRLFTYDGRGEVTADVAFLNGTPTDQGAPLPGRRHEYTYANAGNRLTSNRTGLAGLADHYTTNALNQYTSRENNTLPASGTAAPDAGGARGTAVAINIPNSALAPQAAGRQSRYWNDELIVPNNGHPWRGPVTIFTARRGTGGSPDVYRADTRMGEIAAALQSLTYDNDGNLASDGLVDYTWDAETVGERLGGIVSFPVPRRVP